MKVYSIISYFLLTFISQSIFSKAYAQEKSGKIIYKTIVNGQESARAGKTEVIYHEGVATIKRTETKGAELIPTVPDEAAFIDYNTSKLMQLAILNTGSRFHTSKAFSELPELEITDERQEILGYTCQKATIVLFSNRIDLWFTGETGLQGSPYPNAGLPEGVVLKSVRNGNYEIVAEKVEYIKQKKMEKLLPDDLGELVDATIYKARITDNYVTTVPVFDHEQINWGNKSVNPEKETTDITYHFAGGTVIAKKVKLPEVAEDYTVFAEIIQYSSGDAYDRTGSVFLIPTEKESSFLDGLRNGKEVLPKYIDMNGKEFQGVVATENYEPALEMVRFFTAFGTQAFNEKRTVAGLTWKDSTVYKQDVTYLLPKLQGEVWIGAFIGNYDGGGHNLSLKLQYHPGSNRVQKEEVKKQWIKPLFNTLNLMEMAGQEYGTMFNGDSLKVSFDVPAGLKNVRMEYISTGHGGWGGGDEFNQKLNEIFLDGDKVYTYIPWRSDCATYREFNPASGNFWNGISSSDLSRSGWCPGTATNPVTIPLTELKEGKHSMQIAIPLGEREGGSFSAWNISGVLIGEFE
ncbi:PNGase F N-terminal domain-containing protein [Flammeovirgaceae bacterium SG7u.111]|nr:PNGase F N-terminal domain-containing protein [Flammeovirgaceae bacterium SG7u.132]WPO38404.1 PNGase F N-terminal domain-containing protein [Flammeovirgaceae bacterium SG7u.111]